MSLKEKDAYKDLIQLVFFVLFVALEIFLVMWALFAGGGAEQETNIFIFLISANIGLFGIFFIALIKLVRFFVVLSKGEKKAGWINTIIHDPEDSDIPIKNKMFSWIKNPFILTSVFIIISSFMGLIQVYQNTFLTALPERVPQQVTETAKGILSTIPADMEIFLPCMVAGLLIYLFIWMEKNGKISKEGKYFMVYIIVPTIYTILWTGLHFFHHGANAPAIQYVMLFGIISAYLLVIFRSIIPVWIFKITNNLYQYLNGAIASDERILMITVVMNLIILGIIVATFTFKAKKAGKKAKARPILYIIPIVIVVILLAIFSFQKYSQPVCGDGICQKNEIIEGISFCDIDCKDNCIKTADKIETDIEETCSIGWDGAYLKLLDKGIIKNEYLMTTNEIDFNNPEIQRLANELRRETPKETAKAIAKWTYYNIRYDNEASYYDCKSIKSSEILERGLGVCSTMSKLNIALLRANGIPAYSVTGCFKWLESCKLKQTFFTGRFPRFLDIKVDETGYAPTMGFLHNWVIIQLYEDNELEEIILESTSGLLYENTCIDYKPYYLAPSDSLACGLNQFDTNLGDCEKW